MSFKNYIIVGGGISGLTTAWCLARYAPSTTKITLLEASNRFGGWIESKRVGNHQILFEQGPRTIRPAGIGGLLILDMTNKLNLTSSILSVTKYDPSAINRFIYYPDKLVKLSSSSVLSHIKTLITNKFMWKIIMGIIQEPFIPMISKEISDESIEAFITRRLGSTASQVLMSSLVHGIYAGDVSKLSIRSTFNKLYELERNHGSIIKGLTKSSVNTTMFSDELDKMLYDNMVEENKEIFNFVSGISLFSFKNGIEEFVDAIVKDLQTKENIEIKTGHEVKEMVFGNDCVEVHTNKESICSDHVISTIPSNILYDILPKDYKFSQLKYNPSVSVAIVNFSYDQPNILPVKGFGYLIPKSTQNNLHNVLGVVFDSCTMPYQDELFNNFTKLTVMMGGHYYNDNFDNQQKLFSEEELLNQSLEILENHLGIYNTPADYSVKLARNCIPQYYVGHYDRMKELHYEIKSKLKNRLSVGGASYWGVSLNDCVLNSTKLVLKLLKNNEIITGLEKVEQFNR
ncbi:1833_t:CDS:2 [Entrophospora sp. SA101]|nr:1833_t:CDS:2 [Entrophospora sp. SA101]